MPAPPEPLHVRSVCCHHTVAHLWVYVTCLPNCQRDEDDLLGVKRLPIPSKPQSWKVAAVDLWFLHLSCFSCVLESVINE